MTKKSLYIIFFATIVFCVYFIQAILNEQNRMMHETYELITQPKDKLINSTTEEVKQLSGVLESSYYINEKLELTVGDYSITLEVYGLSTDYKINDKYTLGSGLILNQTAIDEISDIYEKNRKSFTDYYTPKYNLGSDELLFNLDKIITNKTDDEVAKAYLSINQISQLMKKLGKDNEVNSLIIKLINYSYLTEVKDSLSDLDLTITSNTDTITEEAKTYNIHIMYLAIIMVVAFLAVVGVYKEIDGFIMIMGYFVGSLVAICLPYLFPPSERSTIVFGLSASSWFYIVVFAVVAMIITLREVYARVVR